jgi:hypothetical protein
VAEATLWTINSTFRQCSRAAQPADPRGRSVEVLKKYAVFEGRARRKEYWTYTLFSVIIAIVPAIVDAVIGIKLPEWVYTTSRENKCGVNPKESPAYA